jgi:hypothetical protein
LADVLGRAKDRGLGGGNGGRPTMGQLVAGGRLKKSKKIFGDTSADFLYGKYFMGLYVN